MAAARLARARHVAKECATEPTNQGGGIPQQVARRDLAPAHLIIESSRLRCSCCAANVYDSLMNKRFMPGLVFEVLRERNSPRVFIGNRRY